MEDNTPFYTPPAERYISPLEKEAAKRRDEDIKKEAGEPTTLGAAGTAIANKAKEVVGIAPSVAPSLQTVDSLANAPVIDYEARAVDMELSSVFGPEYATKYTPEQIKAVMSDTPLWTQKKIEAREKTEKEFKELVKDPNSQVYQFLNNPSAMDALGEKLALEEVEAEKVGKRIEWWRANLDNDPVAYRAYIRHAEKQGGRVRTAMMPIMDLISWDAATTGGGMAARNFPIARLGGMTWNKIVGPALESPEVAIKSYSSKVDAGRKGFGVLLEGAKKNDKYDKTKVARILSIKAKNPNYFHGNDQGSAEFYKDIKALSPVEQADVLLGLNHQVIRDKKTGRLRELSPTDNPDEGRPLSLTDFDWNLVGEGGEVDIKDVVSRDDFVAMSSQGQGGASIMFAMQHLEKKRANRQSRVAEGKLDPAVWFEENKGKGFLASVPELNSGQAAAMGGVFYNRFISTYEALSVGAAGIYNIFATNTRPNSMFWDIKNAFQFNTTIEEKIAFHRTSMERMHWEEEAFGAKGQSALKMPITDKLIEKLYGPDAARIKQQMRDYGYITGATAEHGFMAFNPAMAAGRIAAGGAVLGTKMERAARLATKIGVSEERVEKIIKGVDTTFHKAMSAPVYVAGWVTMRSGQALLYVPASLAKPIARIGGKILQSSGMLDDATKAEAVVKRGLVALGFTDTFLLGGFSKNLAMAWTIGKFGEEAGHVLSKYLDWRMEGYGFRGAMHAASLDSSLSGATRAIASKLAEGGMFTKYAWDVAKGMYGGAGAMYSMGLMKGDYIDAAGGVATGIGMGGFNAGVHGGIMYVQGHTHHHQARQMLMGEIDSPVIDPATKKKLLEQLDIAERNGDYEYAPRLISTFKRANKLGVQVLVSDTQTLKNNANLRARDIVQLDDADMTVTADGQTRTFKVKEYHAEVERIRAEIAKASASGNTLEVHRLGGLLGEAQSKRMKEINEYLDAVRRSGNDLLKERVGEGQKFAGVYTEDIDGQRFIFMNVDFMDSTTGSHEVFHSVQKLLGLTQAQRTFSQFAYGIKFGQIDENGNRGETVFQKGLFDADDILNYGINYLTRLGGKPEVRDRRIAELRTAVEEMKSLGDKGLLSESSIRTIDKLGEEMGARWYENFISRKPQDYLYFGGKYGKMRQLSDKLVMYLRHNNVIDTNAAGIKANLRRSATEIQSILNKRRILERRRSIAEAVEQDLKDAIKASMDRGMSEQEAMDSLESDPYLKRKLDFLRKYQSQLDAIDGHSFFDTASGQIINKRGTLETAVMESEHKGVRDLFTDSAGNNLVVPEVDAYFEAISGFEHDSPLTTNLNLNEMSGPMLESHLAAMGLEHYGYKDSSGVTRLKDRKVIDAEEQARGKRTQEVLDTLPATRSGVVRTTDKNGNIRYVGVLTDEAIGILSNDQFDHNGQKHSTMPAGVAIKTKTLRDMVINGTDPNSTDFNVLQFLYSALSKEVEGGPRIRKPHGHVEQTFRRVLPYRMEYVITTKDRNGNTVPAYAEMMVTAVDLNVIYRRMANEMNATYTLPSGKVVAVRDLFGGDMDIMHSYFKRYLNELSRNNSRPTAEAFGGGEMGEAVRDIMYRVLGTIPSGGHDFTGKPLAYNNPIIRPFDTWERGPDFAFTTFRVDLMSHLEQIADRIPFNEGAYGKAIGNYQPPSMTSRTPLNDGISFLRTYEGDFEPNSKKNRRSKEPINKATYNVLESNGKFIVSSDLLGKPIEFNSAKDAEDFIHMDYQRAAILANSGKVLNRWNLKGVAVGSTGDNKYVLIDNFDFKNRRSPHLNKLINGMTFSTYDEAFKAAANIHNMMALEALTKSKSLSEQQKQLIRFLVDTQSTVVVGKEAFPLRIEISADGVPVLEPKTKLVDGETVPDVYSEKDVEVQKGIAKVGEQKMKVSFQKMGYNWLSALTGDANVKANDPIVRAYGNRVGKLLAKEMMKFIDDPEVLAGFRWYLDFSERGHKVFGNMFPLVCEALGATSARTPVKTNFEQTTEFTRKYSLGHYDQKIKTIVERLEKLHRDINFVAGDGKRNEWTNRVIRDIVYKRFLSDTAWRKTKGIPDVTFKAFQKNEALLPDTLRAEIEAALKKQLEKPDYEPTPKQIQDAIIEGELAILNMEDTILLRDGDKKFNMNSNKVTMVAVAQFLEKTDGPKTIQFSKNLMGIDHNATIDVWAARTLSRIIHSGILGNKMWRIRPSMEEPVDGKIIRLGSKNMPIMSGSGDFYLGQEAFKVAAGILGKRLGLTMKEFRNLTPANLQAMMWFAEKRVWDVNKWTGEIGAEMSSFDGPLKSIMGDIDATGVMDISHARRLLFGVSGTTSASRVIGYAINEKGEQVEITVAANYRKYPTPMEVLANIARDFRSAFSNKTVSMQVDATTGGYGRGLEDSVYISLNLERGNQINLANQIAEVRNDIRNAENNILKKEADKAKASAAEVGKLEGEIRSLRRQIEKHNDTVAKLESVKAGDASNPDALNQLPFALDKVIQLGKMYQQSDIMASEVVGPNHPNARPMRTVRFDRPIDGEMAAFLIEQFNSKEAKPSYLGVYAFTMEPDPRNPNKAAIDAISKQIAALEVKSRTSKDLGERHKIDTEISELSRKVLKLQRFTSMYTICVPEFSWRFGRESDSIPYAEHIKTLTPEWARSEMETWSKGFDEAYTFVMAKYQNGKKTTLQRHKRWQKKTEENAEFNRLNKKKKGFKPKQDKEEPSPWLMEIAGRFDEYVSTTAVADAGYDFFDLSTVSNQTTLEQNLSRYGQEILRSQRNIDTSIAAENDARNVDEAAGVGTSGVRTPTAENDVQPVGPDAVSGNDARQAVHAKAKRLTQSEALKWLGDRESKSAESESGFIYGDSDLTLHVIKGTDGRATNEVRVLERGMPVAKFNSKAEAEAYAAGRLTGETAPRSIPESLKLGGKEFDVRAGVRALSASHETGKMGANEAVFDGSDNIFLYDFQPIKRTPRKGKPVVTPEEDRAYLQAIRDGDMDLAKALFNDVRSRSDYVSRTYYRATAVDRRDLQTRHLKPKKKGLSDLWAFKNQASADEWVNEYKQSRKGGGEVLKLFVRTGGTPEVGQTGETTGVSVGPSPSGMFDMTNNEHLKLVQGYADQLIAVLEKVRDNPSTPSIDKAQATHDIDAIKRDMAQLRVGDKNYTTFEAAATPQLASYTSDPVIQGFHGQNWLMRAMKEIGFTGHLESEGVASATHAGSFEGIGIHDMTGAKSAEFITRDDNGNVIPLSERFDPSNPDLRYQPPKVDRFRPTRPRFAFSSMWGKDAEVFPSNEDISRKAGKPTHEVILIDPDHAYSARAQAHLKEMQRVLDQVASEAGIPAPKVALEWRNKRNSGIFKGEINVQVIGQAALANFTPLNDGSGVPYLGALTESAVPVQPVAHIDVSYTPQSGSGYLSYASSFNKYSSRNSMGEVSYDDPARILLGRIGYKNPTAEHISAVADIIQGIGGIPYAEMAARLYSLGVGTKYNRQGWMNKGLTGHVVNDTGSLFSARLRGFGEGNSEATNTYFSALTLNMSMFARNRYNWKQMMEDRGLMTPTFEREFRDMITSAENYALSGEKRYSMEVQRWLQKYEPWAVESFFNNIEIAHNDLRGNFDPTKFNRKDVTLRPKRYNKSDTHFMTNPKVDYELVGLTKAGFMEFRRHNWVDATSYISESEVYQPIKWKTIDAQRKRALDNTNRFITSMRGYNVTTGYGGSQSNKDRPLIQFSRSDRDVFIRQLGMAVVGVTQSDKTVSSAFQARIEAIEKATGKSILDIYEDALADNHKRNGRHTSGTTALYDGGHSNGDFWQAVMFADFAEALKPLFEYDARKAAEGAKPDSDVDFTHDSRGFGSISSFRRAGMNETTTDAYRMLNLFLEGTNNWGGELGSDIVADFSIVGPRSHSFDVLTRGFDVLRQYTFEALLKGGMERTEARHKVRSFQDAMRWLETSHYNLNDEQIAIGTQENMRVVKETLDAVGLGKLADSLSSIRELGKHRMRINRTLGMLRANLSDFDPNVQYDKNAANEEAVKVVTEAAKAAGLSDEVIREALAFVENNVSDALLLSSRTGGAQGDKEAKSKAYGSDSFQSAEIKALIDKYKIRGDAIEQGVHYTTSERSAKYIIDMIQDRIDNLSHVLNRFKDGIGNVQEMLSTHAGLSDAEIQSLLGSTFISDMNTATATAEKAQVSAVTKELNRIKKIRAKALAEYTGEATVRTKRKSLVDALKEAAKNGELQEVHEVFALLRSYGVTRVSAAELMEYVRLSSDEQGNLSNPNNDKLWGDMTMASEPSVGPDKASVPKQISEQRDFQLLMLLDGLSGLQAEQNPNTVSITDPDARGWAFRRGQFNVDADKGRYGYRTDGDMRTILEEHHHFLLHQNTVYRRLADVMGNIHASGFEFKAEFEKAMAAEHSILDQMMAEHDAGDIRAAVATLRKLNGVAFDANALTPKQREGMAEAIASAYLGGKAVLLLGELWMRSLKQDAKYFEFSDKSIKFMNKEYPRTGPYDTAADLLFNRELTHTKKRPNDPTLNQMDRHHGGGMERDYGFKSLVEFAAHALNDTNVQGVLSQMKPVVDANGKEPIAVAIETMRRSKNPTVKSYGERLSAVLSSAKNLFDQLMSVIKVMVGFKQEANHRRMGTDYTREQARKNLPKMQGERTAMEQAIEAATLVLPRNKGPAPNMMTDRAMADAAQAGMVAKDTTMKAKKPVTYEATSGDFKGEQILKYLGRVDKSKTK
jgi:hypothetical protein